MKPAFQPQDPFERRLSAIPHAPVPDEWRDSILGAAQAAAAKVADPRRSRWADVWRTPWTILAGAWAVVAVLLVVQHGQESKLRPSLASSVSPALPDPSWSLAARAYRTELLSLIDSPDPDHVPQADPRLPATAPVPAPAMPRSDLRRRAPLDALDTPTLSA